MWTRHIWLSLLLGCSSSPSGNPDAASADASSCSTGSISAPPVKTALVLALDRSYSMGSGPKWTAISQGIVGALDRDVFDALDIGMIAAPSGTVSGPVCSGSMPVYCQLPPDLQVPIQAAGTSKSTAASGPRRLVKDWLAANPPVTAADDSMPLFGLLDAAIGAAHDATESGERIVFIVSDGSPGCGQLGTRPGFVDCNGCDHEWEDPMNLITRAGNANSDAQRPVDTFLVGAPGAETVGANCTTPPYHMRAAFSAIAFAGAPAYASAACTGRTWMQSSADPSQSCHSDQTMGMTASSIAAALADARAAVVGCRFQVPNGPGGGALDRARVNVQYSADGGAAVAIPKRSSPATDCSTQGCWDYVGTSELDFFGHACADARAAHTIAVSVTTGCPTRTL